MEREWITAMVEEKKCKYPVASCVSSFTKADIFIVIFRTIYFLKLFQYCAFQGQDLGFTKNFCQTTSGKTKDKRKWSMTSAINQILWYLQARHSHAFIVCVIDKVTIRSFSLPFGIHQTRFW